MLVHSTRLSLLTTIERENKKEKPWQARIKVALLLAILQDLRASPADKKGEGMAVYVRLYSSQGRIYPIGRGLKA